MSKVAASACDATAPIQFATAEFIYPSPSWSDRIYRRRLFASSTERIFLVLAAVCSLVTCVLLGYLLLHWQLLAFRASRPSSYACVAIGCLTGYASVLTWTVENSALQCAWRVWLVSLAFHAVVQPMLFATYKVYNSTKRRLAPPLPLQRLHLLRIALALPPLALNLLWSVKASPQLEVVQTDPVRPVSSFTRCTYPSVWMWPLVALHCMYAGALLLLMSIFAYRIRHVSATYHDAKALSWSVHLFAVCAFCIGMMQSMLESAQQRAVVELAFVLRSGGTLFVYQATVALLVGHRAYGMRHLANSFRPARVHIEPDGRPHHAHSLPPQSRNLRPQPRVHIHRCHPLSQEEESAQEAGMELTAVPHLSPGHGEQLQHAETGIAALLPSISSPHAAAAPVISCEAAASSCSSPELANSQDDASELSFEQDPPPTRIHVVLELLQPSREFIS